MTNQQGFWGLREAEVRTLDTVYELAEKAGRGGDVPVGAVLLTADGVVAGLGLNQREVAPFDPTAHAEILALREAAGRLGRWNLRDCTLVVSLEPCAMCAGAIVNARVSRLVFGAWDAKAGACGSVRDVVRDPRLNHQVEVLGGVDQSRFEDQLRRFFSRLR